jgi:hypothetical protein
MRTYIMTTGIVFGLLTAVHLWRFIDEGAPVARDPWFLLITIASASLCLWAMRLLRIGVRT